MRSRNQFPSDLFLLLVFPILLVVLASVGIEAISPLISWFLHPTPTPWLWAVGASLGASIARALLLFIAKLPGYRAGHFLRIGSRHLPASHRRLYATSFRIIIPALVTLAALVAAARKF